jgi:hypothetical protein
VVAIVARDLLISTRLLDAATAAGQEVIRVDEPSSLPPAASVSVAFVDWAEREPGWGDVLRTWRDAALENAPRVVLFGPHTDLAAHADARASGLGPMIARSKLLQRSAETGRD